MARLSQFVAFVFAGCIATTSLWADDAKQTKEDSLKALIAKVRESVATIRVEGRDGDQLGIGTGFVVDSSGLIATNYHVINEGRKFTIELSGKKLNVLSVEASDRAGDMVLIRADTAGSELPALELANDKPAEQGTRVLAFGNPLGLKNSVVEGIVSAVREVQGREMIQLAMPIEPGNSGGPLVDMDGRVLGIINMKSNVDDNLGFAIPIEQLTPLREKPNPVSMDRWVRLGTINEQRWTPSMGATWQERGGLISARGMGQGFGGRSLCISTMEVPKQPFEVSVMVRLDDEAGAAGLAFHSDGENKHYGFYPSNGRMRLTCFKGATVYSWQVLEEIDTEHYLPKQWNRLRLRVEDDELKCFVNGHLVVTSTDKQLSSGRIGLVKFRNTNPDFKAFRVGDKLDSTLLSEEAAKWFAQLDAREVKLDELDDDQLAQLGQSGDATARELMRRALELENEAERVRRLAKDIGQIPMLESLRELFAEDNANEDRLLDATLLVARLDSPDIDVSFYEKRIDEMAEEIRETLQADSDKVATREALDDYLFRENGFHGGRSEYYHPANSHLNRVIDDREGLPITLSILYMELGRRLGLQIDGIGLPGHFVVKQVMSDDTHQLIDVFDRGELLSDEEAAQTVLQFAGRKIQEDDLRAQSDQEIVTRVLSNLMGVATRNEDMESMLRYIDAMVAINPDAIDFRMMRMQLRGMTKRNSRAIADIDWLLNKDAEGIDRRRLEQMRAALEK